MQLVTEKDFRLTLGYAFDERFVYEFELKNVTRRISKYNLIMPNYRLSNRLLNLTILSCFFCENGPIIIKDILNHQATRLDTISKTAAT